MCVLFFWVGTSLYLGKALTATYCKYEGRYVTHNPVKRWFGVKHFTAEGQKISTSFNDCIYFKR